MQRTSRTAHLGTAFFLCLGLAVVPVSLRFAGVQLTLSPRLAAAIDVWGQIAEAFGGGYQQGTQSELAAVKDPDGEPSSAGEDSGDRNELACGREVDEAPVSLPEVVSAYSQRASVARRACPKASTAPTFERSPARTSPGELAIHAGAIEAAFKAQANSFESVGSIKVEAAGQREWLSAIERQVRLRRLESKGKINRLEIPHDLRVLIQMKLPAASNKAAECKVRAAMASVRLIELQRAGLVSDQFAGPDNCEF